MIDDPVEGSRTMIDTLRQAGGPPHDTEYPGVGHDCWRQAYGMPELLGWPMSQRRRN
jgi:hypothetical protein